MTMTAQISAGPHFHSIVNMLAGGHGVSRAQANVMAERLQELGNAEVVRQWLTKPEGADWLHKAKVALGAPVKRDKTKVPVTEVVLESSLDDLMAEVVKALSGEMLSALDRALRQMSEHCRRRQLEEVTFPLHNSGMGAQLVRKRWRDLQLYASVQFIWGSREFDNHLVSNTLMRVVRQANPAFKGARFARS